jgi:hypothetical protein
MTRRTVGRQGTDGGESESRRTTPVGERDVADVAEKAATVFVERLGRLLDQEMYLSEAKPIAMVVALSSIEDEPDVERWTPLIHAALARRARSHSVLHAHPA